MIPSIHISAFQELSLKDWHDIAKLRVDVFVVEQACAYPELDGLDSDCLHLLAKLGTELVAYLRIIPPMIHEGTAGIGRVVVDAAYRKQGLGAAIMRKAVDYAEQVFPDITQELHAQVQQESFYASFGFVRVGPDYDWDGIMHVPMRRSVERRV